MYCCLCRKCHKILIFTKKVYLTSVLDDIHQRVTNQYVTHMRQCFPGFELTTENFPIRVIEKKFKITL